MTDEAKAMAETAKLGQEVTKAAVDLGGYVASVLGRIPHDLLGIAVGDWLSNARTRNLGRLEARTATFLTNIQQDRLSEPSPSLLLPFLTVASDESRDELQDIWAALLANTFIDGGRRVRREFLETVKQFEPIDAHVLKVTQEVLFRPMPSMVGSNFNGRWAEVRSQIAAEGAGNAELEVAYRNLVRLGCLDVYPNALLTTYGGLLLSACRVE